jgi:hypothetical protein
MTNHHLTPKALLPPHTFLPCQVEACFDFVGFLGCFPDTRHIPASVPNTVSLLNLPLNVVQREVGEDTELIKEKSIAMAFLGREVQSGQVIWYVRVDFIHFATRTLFELPAHIEVRVISKLTGMVVIAHFQKVLVNLNWKMLRDLDYSSYPP